MKSIICKLALVLGLFSFVGNANAQKFAHVSTDSLIMELAEKDSLQQKLEVKGQEYALQYQMLADEIEKAEQDYQKKERDANMPPSVKELSRKKLQNLYEQAQEFEQNARIELQAYERTLYEPLSLRLKKAIEDVAKEKGYTYVLDAQTLLVSPPADDITNLVRKKLGL